MADKQESRWAQQMQRRLNAYLCRSHYADRYKKAWAEGGYPFDSAEWQKFRAYKEQLRKDFCDLIEAELAESLKESKQNHEAAKAHPVRSLGRRHGGYYRRPTTQGE